MRVQVLVKGGENIQDQPLQLYMQDERWETVM